MYFIQGTDAMKYSYSPPDGVLDLSVKKSLGYQLFLNGVWPCYNGQLIQSISLVSWLLRSKGFTGLPALQSRFSLALSVSAPHIFRIQSLLNAQLCGLWEGVIDSLRGFHVTLQLLSETAVDAQYFCTSAFLQGTQSFTPSACCQLLQVCVPSQVQSGSSTPLLTVRSVMASAHSARALLHSSSRIALATPPLPLSAAQLPLSTVSVVAVLILVPLDVT